MKPATGRTRWALHGLVLLGLAAAVHGLAIWAAPRLIMVRVLDQAAPLPGVNFPPPTDHTQRRIVMPSPDLLYATCVYEVATRPLRVRLDPVPAPDAARYWSLALYAANTDNVFSLNDREAGGSAVDLTLVPASGALDAAVPAGSRTVKVPGTRGLLLMRVLVPDRARDLAAAESLRRALRCEPA